MKNKYHRIYKGHVVATNLKNGCEHEFTLDRYNHPVQCTKCGLFYVDIIDTAITNLK